MLSVLKKKNEQNSYLDVEYNRRLFVTCTPSYCETYHCSKVKQSSTQNYPAWQ